MPTMPASTGTSVGWKGKLASLPRTKKTVSPTPAPTASTATSVRPAALPSAASGCRMSSVLDARFSSLRVITTSPITLASCMGRNRVQGSVADFHRVDDADDGRIDGTVLHAGRHPRRAAADDQHRLADAGIDGVDSDEIAAFGLAVGIHRPGDQELVADEPRVFAGGDDGPDDAGKNHLRRSGLGAGVGLADRQRVLEVRVRPRNDVYGDELPDAPRRGRAGVGRRLDRRDIAADDCRYVAGPDLLPADQRDLGGLDHRVGRLDHGNQPLGLDHSQRLTHRILNHSRSCFTASAMSAVNSPYVSRISPSLLARWSVAVTSGTSRSRGDSGASSTWHRTWSLLSAAGSVQSGAGAAMP